MDIALVHGNFHGAWCWDLLRPELERRGHRVFAMDLPISDPASGAAEYAKAVEDALPADCVPMLVAHSAGGLVAPLVAAQRPVKRLVFLAAFLAVPGKSAYDQRATEPLDGYTPKTSEWTDLGDDVWKVGPNTATEILYNDAAPELAQWAIECLRPQSYGFMSEKSPLAAWPDVECRSIVCRDDHAINPAWVRAAAHDRLGTTAVEIDGGHSPFLTRPAELAAILDSMA